MLAAAIGASVIHDGTERTWVSVVIVRHHRRCELLDDTWSEGWGAGRAEGADHRREQRVSFVVMLCQPTAQLEASLWA